ncbi:hypothetical protein J132_09320 [Termitomyces sp. J132]|nr:hypothetical protein H2248_003258 [Termitomyces sp. 'cryptogamus']KNZ79518.1 hypothetical protein J132_09320 [Termitomyces sp. J132]
MLNSKTHIKRPHNAFFLYCAHLKFWGTRAKRDILSQRWRHADRKFQIFYYELYHLVKDVHRRLYPHYRYRPVYNRKKKGVGRKATSERFLPYEVPNPSISSTSTGLLDFKQSEYQDFDSHAQDDDPKTQHLREYYAMLTSGFIGHTLCEQSLTNPETATIIPDSYTVSANLNQASSYLPESSSDRDLSFHFGDSVGTVGPMESNTNSFGPSGYWPYPFENGVDTANSLEVNLDGFDFGEFYWHSPPEDVVNVVSPMEVLNMTSFFPVDTDSAESGTFFHWQAIDPTLEYSNGEASLFNLKSWPSSSGLQSRANSAIHPSELFHQDGQSFLPGLDGFTPGFLDTYEVPAAGQGSDTHGDGYGTTQNDNSFGNMDNPGWQHIYFGF